MIKPPNLTTAQFEESVQKLRQRSLLETFLYHSLIHEPEEHLITTKDPYLLKTAEEIEAYPHLLHYLFLTALLPNYESAQYYFHLEGIEIKKNSGCQKATAEDNMHNNIQLTLVYV